MSKVKDFIASTKGKVVAGVGFGLIPAIGATVMTFADDSTSSGIGSVTAGLQSGLQHAGTDALSVIGTVLPYALPILAAGIAIVLGIRFFKKAAK